jgi:hypothetical protein
MKRWLFSAILRFFGISSPAVLLMAALSYFGFKTPVPDAPGDSPDAIAQRAKKIIETVSTAKAKLQETISAFAKDDDSPTAPKRPAVDDEDLQNVTYQELFEEDKPTSAPPPSRVATQTPPPKRVAAQPPPFTPPNRPGASASERPPAKVSDRDRKKPRGDSLDRLSDTPYR